ncbi:hypothetical protein BDW02DRAFT_497598 [Decorospora gaudefroyi]|uniref:Secretory phospholipase A2 n=1 Tax=Decorospora gaudefroyi TaxID=184978 RepID=A0A6A5KA41_9PLEO|nr:hypothetical protein BDW02DRAFT_497598 [Decorospora gaudefroyi]
MLGLAALSLAVSESTPSASPSPSPSQSKLTDVEEITEKYLFNITLSEFIANREARTGPSELIWASDQCTDAPENPFGFDFTRACYRHDFGYRNFQKQNRWTVSNKARIDSNFKKDMFKLCQDETFQDACEGTAILYYEAVRVWAKEGRRAVEQGRGAVDGEEGNWGLGLWGF